MSGAGPGAAGMFYGSRKLAEFFERAVLLKPTK
jgi:hypothetical protein